MYFLHLVHLKLEEKLGTTKTSDIYHTQSFQAVYILSFLSTSLITAPRTKLISQSNSQDAQSGKLLVSTVQM